MPVRRARASKSKSKQTRVEAARTSTSKPCTREQTTGHTKVHIHGRKVGAWEWTRIRLDCVLISAAGQVGQVIR